MEEWGDEKQLREVMEPESMAGGNNHMKIGGSGSEGPSGNLITRALGIGGRRRRGKKTKGGKKGRKGSRKSRGGKRKSGRRRSKRGGSGSGSEYKH